MGGSADALMCINAAQLSGGSKHELASLLLSAELLYWFPQSPGKGWLWWMLLGAPDWVWGDRATALLHSLKTFYDYC